MEMSAPAGGVIAVGFVLRFRSASHDCPYLMCRRDADRRRFAESIFFLGLFDPAGKGLLAHDAYRDRHESVVFAAKLRALSVIDAFARRLEPGLVDPARDGIDLDSERGNRKGMDDVGSGGKDMPL